jgi:hypothetical protein
MLKRTFFRAILLVIIIATAGLLVFAAESPVKKYRKAPARNRRNNVIKQRHKAATILSWKPSTGPLPPWPANTTPDYQYFTIEKRPCQPLFVILRK